MTKGFMEVFPELALEQEVRALFEKVKVERVTTTRQKDLIRVYISCGRLIPKTVIFRVEEEIARQLFPNCNITIKIQEKFQLSAQYNLKSLLETYQESILLELKECSPVEYSLFKSANISFPDEGKLVLEVPDTVIAHERCPELVRILEKICCERCGIPMEAVAHYCQPKENPRKAEEEIALARKVAMIAAKAGARPAATDYGMSQEQFASVMSGGYSASGNDGQPQYAGGQDGTACNAAQNADSSAAQYGAAGIAGQNGAMPGDRAESSMQAGGMDAGYEAYLASMGAAAQEAPFEGGTMVPAEAAAAANRMRPDAPAAGQSAPAMGQTAALRQARTVPHRLAAEMRADRANTAKANSTGRGVAIIAAALKKVTIRMCFTDGILTKKQSRSRRSSVRWERLLSAAKSSQWISVKFATSGQS